MVHIVTLLLLLIIIIIIIMMMMIIIMIIIIIIMLTFDCRSSSLAAQGRDDQADRVLPGSDERKGGGRGGVIKTGMD